MFSLHLIPCNWPLRENVMDEGFDQVVVAPTTKNPKPPKPVAEKTPKQKLESATRHIRFGVMY